MVTTATGILKQVRIASESTFGTAPGAGTANLLRRVASEINADVANFRSNEIQPDRQVHDFRHGMRQIRGTLKGELSPLTWKSVFAAALAGTFTSGVSNGVANIAGVAAVLNTSPGYFLRATGSWITDGFKVGDIVRATGFAGGGTANNNRNYRVTGIIQTTNPGDTLQLGPTPTTANPSVGNEAVAAIASAAGVTVTVTGKKLITPLAGSLVDSSFTLEHWFSDVSVSEMFTGCRPNQMAVSLPPTGIATCDTSWLGQNVTTAGSAYFTTPSAVTTSAVISAVNGLLRVGTTDYAVVTGLNFTIDFGATTEAVVGSNVTPYIWPGIQDIKGSFSALFQDGTFRDDMLNETEVSLHCYLSLNNALVNADFLSFYFPRIKVNTATKNDRPTDIIGQYSFQALNQIAGGTGTTMDATTLTIQDSLA